jgi:hypothetical protein
MSRLLMLIVCLMLLVPAFAQFGKDVNHTIIMQVGICSVPEELAGVKSVDGKNYVEDGLIYSLGYTAELHRFFSLGASVGRTSNELNQAAIAGASLANVKTETFRQTLFFADAYAKLPYKSWQLYLKGSYGSIIPDTWELQVENKSGSGSIHTIQEFSPAYAGGLGINYRLGKVNIGLESILVSTKPEFKIRSNNSITFSRQWISAYNHMLRLGYRL